MRGNAGTLYYLRNCSVNPKLSPNKMFINFFSCFLTELFHWGLGMRVRGICSRSSGQPFLLISVIFLVLFPWLFVLRVGGLCPLWVAKIGSLTNSLSHRILCPGATCPTGSPRPAGDRAPLWQGLTPTSTWTPLPRHQPEG